MTHAGRRTGVNASGRKLGLSGCPGSPPCGTISTTNCVEGTLGPHLMESHDETVVCVRAVIRCSVVHDLWKRSESYELDQAKVPQIFDDFRHSVYLCKVSQDLVGEMETFVFPCLSRLLKHKLMTRVRVLRM